jgi:hypothetical protein
VTALHGLDPETYVPHALHHADAAYPETNCWTDVVIELLHARGDEPLAALGCTLALDHEGDQFTFFKPRPDELEALYGIDVHELQPYRPLAEHLRTQLELGRTLIVEVDGWWLPDTAGTSYRQQHVKTAVAVEALHDDRLVYFHNSGLYALSGDDLTGVLAPPGLPGYVETVRFDAGPTLSGEELRTASVELLRDNLLRRPDRNPFTAYGEQLGKELDDVLAHDEGVVHVFAFATTRMAGAAAALAAAHVRWALPQQDEGAAACLDRVAAGTKTLTFRLVRRKPFDPAPLVDALAADWAEAHERLDELVG